ncbi:uncharacterized protein [Halyomorpha halys]|uniref:uncharacterized protein n=1 Tax=Halyomorpha halys TaxID=286706 RepID=UPI0006D50288|nr:uncharacterized protein LOC106678755 [Halyomorpha halys]
MFVNEKTPLRGSNNYVPYSFMSDRQGSFKRKVRQYQCFICVSVLLTCALLVVLAILLYPDASDMADNFNQSDLLQLPLKKASLNARMPVDQTKNLESPEPTNIVQMPKSWKSPRLKEDPVIEDITLKKLSSCSLSKYRSTNGLCNNLAHPTWGAAGQPFNRLIQSDYCNGISTQRCSSNKTDLPSPYLITSKISSWNDGRWTKYVNDVIGMTTLLWGAFIYQDMINVPEYGLPKQLNLATSFLDGSNIYGNGIAAEKKVRTYFNGELILNKYKEQNYSAINRYWKCQNGFLDFQLFDKVMIKQHNFIASELKKINSLWNDDRLFYEAKRIVIAQIQHVTYNQFLEYIIGEHQVEEFDLKPYPSGYNKKYDEAMDPTISNVFAAATFKSVFAKLSKARMQLRCDFYSHAHDIERGREYGLPGYLKWREFCGLHQPASFDELYQLMGTNNTNNLKEIYSDLDDIDLFVGIISEIPIEGSIFGEVGLCLMTDQFKRLKNGDRYWYETDQPLQRFSEEQLAEIRKTTITELICNNLEMNGGFLRSNTSLECSINSQINLKPWLENEPMQSDNLLGKEEDTYEIVKRGKSLNNNVLSTKNTSVIILKRSYSLTMNVANITAISNGSILYEVYNQKPPILLPLDRVIDPNAYGASTDANFRATVDGNIISGSATVPLKNLDGPNYSLKLQFEADISFKWGKTVELDGKEEYQCRVLFQSYTKLSNTIARQNDIPKSNFLSEVPGATEQCTIMLVGMFYQRPFYCSVFPWWCLEGQFFYWSGDMKMVFKSITNNPNSTDVNKLKTGGQKTFTIKQKTENVKVDKEFASVTVVSGLISGNFDTNDTIDVPISPPLDIYLDHIVSPSAYDTSFEVTFSGTPTDDSSINGQFTMAYFPILGKGTKKTVKATFNFDFVYKYGGSIDIIEPSKTYTCKVMFPSVKRSTFATEENDMLLSRTIKGKTPFGESCSIMFSGYFQTPSFYCYLTPWWCTDEKVFHWNGDAELTLKYKYNTTDNDIIANHAMVTAVGKKRNTAIDSSFQYNYNDFEDKFMGHRLGGKVRKGWVQVKNSGLFQPSKTIWSGELPTTIDLPIFWTPGDSEDQLDLSDVFGHEVIWSCSVFQSTLQGTFSFPQYVGHGPSPLVNWMKGKFHLELETDENVSIYNMIIPGMSYRSRVNFHEERNPDFVPFITPQRGGGPANDNIYQGIRAPLILLGKYSLDRKSFSWNGSFIIVFTKSAKDFMLF